MSSYKKPVYTIGIASEKVGVCAETLRIWERRGLIKPQRLGKDRFYSEFEINRLKKIKELTHNKGINIEGVKNIIKTTHCWEVKNCDAKEKRSCPVYKKYSCE